VRIESVRIQNLRAFKDETVRLDDYTCLVGPNGAGKSTVLCALSIFFRSTSDSPIDLAVLNEEDFHRKDTSHPIRITVTFCDLNAQAMSDFADYVRQNRLVVSAVAEFDPASRTAPVRQMGERLGIRGFRSFFAKKDGNAKLAELQAAYADLRKVHSALEPSTKTKEAMAMALREFEASNPSLCELIPSNDEFYGFTKGANRLAKYVQWVFVPAVKDATSEQQESKNGALGKLLARTVRVHTDFSADIERLRAETQEKYQSVLDTNQKGLDAVSNALRERLADWAHPEARIELRWQRDEKAVRVTEPLAGIIAGEGDFEGELARFGHGLQRSYLLALLQELASCEQTNAPTLILACEEPELFQHPPQARHLAGVLRHLSQKNAQVLVCTHSPHFVSGRDFGSVRLARKQRGTWESRVSQVTAEAAAHAVAAAREEKAPNTVAANGKLFQELNPSLSEMFFTPVLVLVEGIEDVAYVTTYLALLGLTDEYRRLGCHMVAANGKGHMMQPRAVAKALSIPTFTVFDSDGHETDKLSKNGRLEMHRKDNLALLRLCGAAKPDAFPADNYWGPNFVVWRSEIGDVVKTEIGPEWAVIREEVAARYGFIRQMDKNALFIGEVLSAAWDRGLKSPSLETLCNELLAFAKGAA
jgi:putative ATP-dependent endonuclease of the OLD family